MISKVLKLFLVSFLLSNGVVSSLSPPGDDYAGGHNWTNHDQVVPFSQNASPGLEGQFELRFNPYIFVARGCDPYPAVDVYGNLGGGLRPVNGRRSGCGAGGLGQVYARRGESQGHIGIMYSYYMPKVRWGRGNNKGHRHYWASVVVWVNRWGCKVNDPTAVWPVGVSFTTDHKNWGTAAADEISFRPASRGVVMATHPKLRIRDNAISAFTGADSRKVYERTLISWDSLSDAARQALEDVRYEKTEVPFTEANFQARMDAAYQDGLYSVQSDQQGCGEYEAPPTTASQPVPAPSNTTAPYPIKHLRN